MKTIKLFSLALCLVFSTFVSAQLVCPPEDVVRNVKLTIVEKDDQSGKYVAGEFYRYNNKDYVVVTGLFDKYATALKEGQELLRTSTYEPEINHNACVYFLDAQHMKLIISAEVDGAHVANISNMVPANLK